MNNQTPGVTASPDRSDAARPDVSIIIVNWNTRDLLRDCLRSIREQAGPVTCQTIVIDNHSSDDSAAMVEREFPEVRLIRNATNLGFAAANNQGIVVATGRYVLLLNSDTIVLDGAIAKAIAFADAHPKAGMVGCRTVMPGNILQVNCYLFPSLLNLALSLSPLSDIFERNRFFGRRRMTWWDYDTVREVDGIAGCFMLARREAVEQVGPMTEDYFMYSEDTDWCWRFHRAGWKVMFTPDAQIIHKGRASSSQCATDMHLLERRALLMFLERKSGRQVRWLANAMFVTGAVVRLPLLVGPLLLGGERADQARRKWRVTLMSLRFHLFGRLPDDLRERLEAGTNTAGRIPAEVPARGSC